MNSIYKYLKENNIVLFDDLISEAVRLSGAVILTYSTNSILNTLNIEANNAKIKAKQYPTPLNNQLAAKAKTKLGLAIRMKKLQDQAIQLNRAGDMKKVLRLNERFLNLKRQLDTA